MKPQELYDAGRLQEAISAAAEEVRQQPADVGRRWFLAELLLFAGDYERADKHLDALPTQDPQVMAAAALLRQLLRSEQARQQCFTEGRLPEFLGQPPEWLKKHLEASIRLREGQPAEAARLLAEAEAARPRVRGTCNGKAFDDFRDIDDLMGGFFEVLTSTGKYYWVPADRVDTVEFHPPRRAYDLIWRKAHMVVREGPDGEVYLPTLYPGAAGESDDRFRLGRLTDWRGGDGVPVRGVGQRSFLVGDDELSILELQNLSFEAPAAP
jgi:type VI secretion system protein ImpE